MPAEYFMAKCDRASVQEVLDLIGWVSGKGKDYDVSKAPIFYPNRVVNMKKAFGNWLVLAKVRFIQVAQDYHSSSVWKVIKVAICGRMSLFPKGSRRGGPPTYVKLWKLKACTPGMIALSVTSVSISYFNAP